MTGPSSRARTRPFVRFITLRVAALCALCLVATALGYHNLADRELRSDMEDVLLASALPVVVAAGDRGPEQDLLDDPAIAELVARSRVVAVARAEAPEQPVGCRALQDPQPGGPDCLFLRSELPEAGSEEAVGTVVLALGDAASGPEAWTRVEVDLSALDTLRDQERWHGPGFLVVGTGLGALVAWLLALWIRRGLVALAEPPAPSTGPRPTATRLVVEVERVDRALRLLEAQLDAQRSHLARRLTEAQAARTEAHLARVLVAEEPVLDELSHGSTLALGGRLDDRADGCFHLLLPWGEGVLGLVGRVSHRGDPLGRTLEAQAARDALARCLRRGGPGLPERAELHRLARVLGLAELRLGQAGVESPWTWAPLEQPEPVPAEPGPLALHTILADAFEVDLALRLWSTAPELDPGQRLAGIRGSLPEGARGRVVLLRPLPSPPPAP